MSLSHKKKAASKRCSTSTAERLARVERTTAVLEATGRDVADQLDEILERQRALENTVSTHSGDLGRHSVELGKLTEISANQVRLQERTMAGGKGARRAQRGVEVLMQRVAKLEAHVANLKASAVGAGGAGAVVGGVLWELAKAAHMIPGVAQ